MLFLCFTHVVEVTWQTVWHAGAMIIYYASLLKDAER